MARRDSVERAMEKVGGFATAKKNIVIQYQGRERTEEHILQCVMRDAIKKGAKDDEIELVDLYIKPEEQTVFYVLNKDITGSIEF